MRRGRGESRIRGDACRPPSVRHPFGKSGRMIAEILETPLCSHHLERPARQRASRPKRTRPRERCCRAERARPIRMRDQALGRAPRPIRDGRDGRRRHDPSAPVAPPPTSCPPRSPHLLDAKRTPANATPSRRRTPARSVRGPAAVGSGAIDLGLASGSHPARVGEPLDEAGVPHRPGAARASGHEALPIGRVVVGSLRTREPGDPARPAAPRRPGEDLDRHDIGAASTRPPAPGADEARRGRASAPPTRRGRHARPPTTNRVALFGAARMSVGLAESCGGHERHPGAVGCRSQVPSVIAWSDSTRRRGVPAEVTGTVPATATSPIPATLTLAR